MHIYLFDLHYSHERISDEKTEALRASNNEGHNAALTQDLLSNLLSLQFK